MEMDNIVTMCGLACTEYIVYVASQKNDYDLRQKAIEAWSTQTERLTPSDIDYDGGHVGKRIYKFCSSARANGFSGQRRKASENCLSNLPRA